jgi:hypothetical protein
MVRGKAFQIPLLSGARHSPGWKPGSTAGKDARRHNSMTVAAAAAAMSAAAVALGMTFARAGRGEGGKFLGQLLRTAVRASGSLPIAGTDEDFAVAPALFAMKLVNRHEGKIIGRPKISSDKRRKILPFLSTTAY